MRDRRDDERNFRGPMMGRDDRGEDRFRDQERDREWERERAWRRGQDMGGSQWSGASGRGGFESRYDMRDEDRGYGGYGYGFERGYDPTGWERSFDASDRGPHFGKGPKGYKRSDERIREDVCDCIAQQGYIDATDVEVKVESGTVVLTGTVGQRQEKRALEQMADRVHGVNDVRNELRLKRDEETRARTQAGPPQNGDQQRTSQLPNGKNARS